MKLGIVGSGMIVNEVLSFIQDIQGIELIHISGTKRSEGKLKKIKEDYHFHRFSTDYSQLLGDEEVDTIYVALPNHLHYEYTKQALLAKKNVVLEKPFTSTIEEALELQKIAIQNHLFLWEAITNQYLSHYQDIKRVLPSLGDIKVVECNFSQYSSRYNAFKDNNILPAFDYKKSGGALMDLNIYNIHFVVGLFGKPQRIEYFPNIEKNIDTSGILVLGYDSFQCVCIGAKDCSAPLSNHIQGDKGCICIDTPVGIIEKFDVLMNDGEHQTFAKNDNRHRMYEEFVAFEKMYYTQDYDQCYQKLNHSMIVMGVLTEARRKAGIFFPADN